MDKLAKKRQQGLPLYKLKGFSTIELMIAFAIMSLVLTAVVLVSFGNQSFFVGSQTNAEALKLAQGLIEQEQAFARKDFNLVNPVAEVNDDIYKKSVSVNLLSDYLTKEVKALIKWKDERGMDRNLELTTLIANFDTPVGGNTCNSTLSGNWSAPQIESTIDFSTLSGIPAGTYTLTDLDAYKNKLYVTANDTANIADPTFFVFNISNPASPSLVGQADNANTITSGLNGVSVAEDPATNFIYAYTVSDSASNYSTCDPTTDFACGQLDIFDVTASVPELKTNLKITSSPAITNQNTGTSIFYKNGYLLLGLSANGGGPEFHLFDMHRPSDLFGGSHSVAPIGSFEVGHDVNALSMRRTYAYLASPNAQELQILNLTDPTCPPATCFVGNFGTGSGNGKSMQLVGNKIYFGRATDGGGSDDFEILDNTSPTTTLPKLGGLDLSSSVNSVVVRDYLSFLLTGTPGTGSQLQIFKTDDPVNITLWAPSLSLSATGHATEPSMDCEGNRIFISSNDASGQGAIYIIKPGV